jgi:hypothetical protein
MEVCDSREDGELSTYFVTSVISNATQRFLELMQIAKCRYWFQSIVVENLYKHNVLHFCVISKCVVIR